MITDEILKQLTDTQEASVVIERSLAKGLIEARKRIAELEAERDSVAKREYELLKHIRDGKTLKTNKEFDYERYHPYINAGYVNGLCFRYEKEHPLPQGGQK